jgi:hypothetical protein
MDSLVFTCLFQVKTRPEGLLCQIHSEHVQIPIAIPVKEGWETEKAIHPVVGEIREALWAVGKIVERDLLRIHHYKAKRSLETHNNSFAETQKVLLSVSIKISHAEMPAPIDRARAVWRPVQLCDRVVWKMKKVTILFRVFVTQWMKQSQVKITIQIPVRKDWVEEI